MPAHKKDSVLVKLRQRFNAHRGNARKINTVFLLTFEEWLKLWIDSGHLHERGCRKGQYVMARFGDKGPYAVGNVKIITHEENLAERVLSAEWRENKSQFMTGNQYWVGYKHSAKARAKMSKSQHERQARLRAEVQNPNP